MEDKKSNLKQRSTASLLQEVSSNIEYPNNEIIRELFERKFETTEQAKQIINVGEKLAMRGNVEAQFQLGCCYGADKWVKYDSKKMMKFYKISC